MTDRRASSLADDHPAVACEGVTVELGGRTILREVDLRVEPGQWVAVVGPNGAGKSTLLRSLLGAVRATGTVHLDGRDRRGLSPRDQARLVALVPQLPIVPPQVRVADYVLLGRVPHHGPGVGPSDDDLRLATAVIQRLDLDDLTERRVDSLSGGERQRVVVARAIAQEAPILLLDEPTTSLDLGHQLEVLELIDQLRTERGLTVLSTLHDLTLAGQFADRLVLLADGAIHADGPPTTVLTQTTIERHFGACVEVTVDDQGISVAVRRRKEASTRDRHPADH